MVNILSLDGSSQESCDFNRGRFRITDVFPLKNKDAAAPWAYRVHTKSVGSGKTAALTVKSFIYNDNPINKLDIIFAGQLTKNNRGYWYLWDYTIIG